MTCSFPDDLGTLMRCSQRSRSDQSRGCQASRAKVERFFSLVSAASGEMGRQGAIGEALIVIEAARVLLMVPNERIVTEIPATRSPLHQRDPAERRVVAYRGFAVVQLPIAVPTTCGLSSFSRHQLEAIIGYRRCCGATRACRIRQPG